MIPQQREVPPSVKEIVALALVIVAYGLLEWFADGLASVLTSLWTP